MCGKNPSEVPASSFCHRPASTLPWNNPAPVVLLQPEENEEEHNMSALFEYFSLFDFFIVAALVGIFCCGLLDGETSRSLPLVALIRLPFL
jgi:hypothetical protein